MTDPLKKVSRYIEQMIAIKESIIANIVFIGQEPAPTFQEEKRGDLFLERLMEENVDECTRDGFQNPIGIIRGTDRDKPPIFVAAHMDTPFSADVSHNFTVAQDTIVGAGILDNSIGVGALASLPLIFKTLDLRFRSDIVLAGVIQSIGKGNLMGIRHLVQTWSTPIRGAVVIEGGEIGRLSYSTLGMIRGEILCSTEVSNGFEPRFKSNAILVLNEVINQILQLTLPQRPRSRIIFGQMRGGHKHGWIAEQASLGLEIQSDSDEMVQKLYADISDIVEETKQAYEVDLTLEIISNLNASKLPYTHPLVQQAVAVLGALDVKPTMAPSESELSIFLSHGIPAITVGVTRGRDYHLQQSEMEIQPMFKGLAQIVALIQAIDSGVCDET